MEEYVEMTDWENVFDEGLHGDVSQGSQFRGAQGYRLLVVSEGNQGLISVLGGDHYNYTLLLIQLLSVLAAH